MSGTVRSGDENYAEADRLVRRADPEGDYPDAPYILPMLVAAQVHATLAVADYLRDLVSMSGRP